MPDWSPFASRDSPGTGVLARRTGQPCVVGVGEHDRFLPPRRLAPALRRAMDLDLRILPGMGHLATPGHLDDVVSLVAEAARPGYTAGKISS